MPPKRSSKFEGRHQNNDTSRLSVYGMSFKVCHARKASSPNPNLDHLKHQAKDLIRPQAARDRQAAQRIIELDIGDERLSNRIILEECFRRAQRKGRGVASYR